MKKAPRPEGVLLAIRVQPRARQDEVVGWQGATLRVRVTAPPSEGRANEAVVRLLADALGVPRSAIALVRGAASRDKLFRIGAPVSRGDPRGSSTGRARDLARPLGRLPPRAARSDQAADRGSRAALRRPGPKSPRRSARSSCAGRRPSASPPPSALRSPRAGAARDDWDGLMADLEEAIKGLAATRPTAVNLFWALDRMRRAALAHRAAPLGELRQRLHEEAQAILDEDVAANRAMGAHGVALVPAGAAHPHALQRRRAGHRGIRHGARRDPRGARAGTGRARVGRRDAAGHAGLAAHRLGARPGRHSAPADLRRGRGLRDAAGATWTW